MVFLQIMAACVCAHAAIEAFETNDSYVRDMAAVVAVVFGAIAIFAF